MHSYDGDCWAKAGFSQESVKSGEGRPFGLLRDAPRVHGVLQHSVNGRRQLGLVLVGDGAVDDALRLDAVVAAELADAVMVEESHRGGDVEAEPFVEVPYEVVAGLADVTRDADVLGPLKTGQKNQLTESNKIVEGSIIWVVVTKWYVMLVFSVQ